MIIYCFLGSSSLTFNEDVLSAIFDLIKSPVASADFLIIFLPANLPNSVSCFFSILLKSLLEALSLIFYDT